MKMKKTLLCILLAFFACAAFAENIDDIFDVVKKSGKAQLVAYLEQNGFERYNLTETNGNLYFQPKAGKNITFYGVRMNVVVFGYYKNNSDVTFMDVSVKSWGNENTARRTKNLLIEKYGFVCSARNNALKSGNYSFSYSEYLDDVYGYISFSFGNW